MPKRTVDQADRINSMAIEPAGKYCNARHGKGKTGRCRQIAGHGTDHVGRGRCHLHGGASISNITTGLYSEKYTSTLRAESARIQADPAFISLSSELVAMRLALGGIIGSLSETHNNGSNPYVAYSEKGVPIIAPEARLLIEFTRIIADLMSTIAKLEKESGHVLTIGDINAFVKQFKEAMSVTCGSCPVKAAFTQKVELIRVAPTSTLAM